MQVYKLLSDESEQKLETSWEWLVKKFPFNGYVHPARKESYLGKAREAVRYLEPGAKILDFGSGPLDKTAIFSQQGFDVTAFDDYQDTWHLLGNNREKIFNFAELANINLVDSIENQSFSDAFGDGFDMIMLHHVLEHIHDSPRQLLNDLISLLKPGGIIFLTVPNAVNLRKRITVALGNSNYQSYSSYYWYPGEFRGHIREYVNDDLVQLAKFQGLDVERVGNYNHFWNAVPNHLKWGVRILCRLVPSFSDSCSLIARKPANWQPKEELAINELNDALGRTELYDYTQH
jgi:2-polyprenyl-3-methyl-5-hydroxy-6-metoxy-1,4-benzoquinol methylase